MFRKTLSLRMSRPPKPQIDKSIGEKISIKNEIRSILGIKSEESARVFISLGTGFFTMSVAAFSLWGGSELSGESARKKVRLDKLRLAEDAELAKNAQIQLAIEELDRKRSPLNAGPVAAVEATLASENTWLSKKRAEMRRKQELISLKMQGD